MTGEAPPFVIALVQMDPVILDPARNRATMLARLQEAAGHGASVVVFPECALSGYVFESADAAMPGAETVPGPATGAILDACRSLSVYAIFGLIERSSDGGALYNSAAVCGPEGLIAVYRKSHLPILGIDRYVERGNSLPVIDLGIARIGMLICYDIRFPECARSLALRGADVIVLPTNWPEGADSAPDFLTRARAWENRVYVAACNRTGTERGVRFIGRSQVVSPAGRIQTEAPSDSEAIIYAEIDPNEARRKRIVIKQGEFELDPIRGRRPELYHDLV